MDTNVSMMDRFFAIILDLVTFFGYFAGVCMIIFTVNEINTEVEEAIISRHQLIKLGIIMVVCYYVLDVFLTRLFATTPGKLCMNCDVDFHKGNTMIYNVIRSFFKVVCLFTVIPAVISYLYACVNSETRAIHDSIVKSNVTNSTRAPRSLGIFVTVVGICLLSLFLFRYHEVLGLTVKVGLSEFKIFTFD